MTDEKQGGPIRWYAPVDREQFTLLVRVGYSIHSPLRDAIRADLDRALESLGLKAIAKGPYPRGHVERVEQERDVAIARAEAAEKRESELQKTWESTHQRYVSADSAADRARRGLEQMTKQAHSLSADLLNAHAERDAAIAAKEAAEEELEGKDGSARLIIGEMSRQFAAVAAQARAIRFIANEEMNNVLLEFADRVERGEISIP